MNHPNEIAAPEVSSKRWETPTLTAVSADRNTNGGGVPGGPDVVLTTTTVGS